MTTPNQPIGLIGVGLLGLALARRLIEHNFTVVGYDLDSTRLEALQNHGGEPTQSAAMVVERCDTIILSLPDHDVVARLMCEVQRELVEGKILLDTTTGEPKATASLGQRLMQDGVAYIDATVAGSSAQAARGDTIMMVGGPEEVVATCEPILSALCKQYFHVGDCGHGARMKLVVNLVLGLNRAALAEGLVLANSCGIDLNLTLEILKSSPAYSATMTTKGRKMIKQEFTPQGRLSQHLKDVNLIQCLAREVGAATPLESTHEHLLRRAAVQGYGDSDNCAIIKAYNY